MAKSRYVQVMLLKEGDEVKWDHQDWRKVLKADLKGQFMHLKLEGMPRECTIYKDVELPFR